MSQYPEIQPPDEATRKFNELIKTLTQVSQKCFKDRVQELLQLGPEEQKRLDAKRRIVWDEERDQHWRDERMLRLEAEKRAGMPFPP